MSMETDADTVELYSLLIPLHADRLLLPRICVAEVIRYVGVEPVMDGPEWLRGHIDWNGRSIPVISFERLAGLASAEPGGRSRIAVIGTMDATGSAGSFGLVTEGFPQLVRVNRDVVQPHDPHPWPEGGPVLCQVRLINEHPLIPDLEHIEALLAGEQG